MVQAKIAAGSERGGTPAVGARATPWFALAIFVVLADQLSKWFARAHLLEGEVVPVIGRFFNWTLAYNKGAAFSFLAAHGGWQRWFFTALALVMSAVLIAWIARTPRRDWRTAMPLALILGGAIGNVIDRIALGQVTDFVLVYFGDWPYPAFNVADAGISVGAVLLLGFGFVMPARVAGRPD